LIVKAGQKKQKFMGSVRKNQLGIVDEVFSGKYNSALEI